MKEFPNYLMSANGNNKVADYYNKQHSAIEMNYTIEKKSILKRQDPEIIMTSTMANVHTRRPFQPTQVPSLLRGIKNKDSIDYAEIYKALTLNDMQIILCDNKCSVLEKDLEQVREDTKAIRKTVSTKIKKKRSLNRTLEHILLQETHTNKLMTREKESKL